MSNAKSPLFNHLNSAINGAISIRAYGIQDWVESNTREKVNKVRPFSTRLRYSSPERRAGTDCSCSRPRLPSLSTHGLPFASTI